MKKNPLISIIMNCHNGEKFLPEAIESIKNQTYKTGKLFFGIMPRLIKSLKIFKNLKEKSLNIF